MWTPQKSSKKLKVSLLELGQSRNQKGKLLYLELYLSLLLLLCKFLVQGTKCRALCLVGKCSSTDTNPKPFIFHFLCFRLIKGCHLATEWAEIHTILSFGTFIGNHEVFFWLPSFNWRWVLCLNTLGHTASADSHLDAGAGISSIMKFVPGTWNAHYLPLSFSLTLEKSEAVQSANLKAKSELKTAEVTIVTFSWCLGFTPKWCYLFQESIRERLC